MPQCNFLTPAPLSTGLGEFKTASATDRSPRYDGRGLYHLQKDVPVAWSLVCNRMYTWLIEATCLMAFRLKALELSNFVAIRGIGHSEMVARCPASPKVTKAEFDNARTLVNAAWHEERTRGGFINPLLFTQAAKEAMGKPGIYADVCGVMHHKAFTCTNMLCFFA